MKDFSKSGPRHFGGYLPGNLTNALNHRIDEDLRLRQVWIRSIPDPLASRARPVRYVDGLLFVHADTPAWANRVHHQKSALMTSLRRDPSLRDLREIRVRAVPRDPVDAPSAASRRPTRLSASAARIIAETAATITHPELRAALERLAALGGNSNSKRTS
ncbi:MAG: DciA family protein [Sulfurifustaceae bacterium]